MLESLVICLLLTLVIELTVSILLGIRQKNDILLVICANTCTNPVVVFLSNCAALPGNIIIYIFAVAILEILALFSEYIIYRKGLIFDDISPMAVSFINNATSFGVGIIITHIL